MAEALRKEEEQSYDRAMVVKCASCGADMYFDIAANMLRCPYCDSTEAVDAQVYEYERSIEGFDDSTLKRDTSAITYQCPNCHAKTVMHDYGTSMQCPFCGATNILETDDIPGLAPDAILPFKITQAEASTNSLKWLKRRIYAPVKLKKSFTPENLRSVYCPTFTFDSNTYSSYEGRLGKYYTQTVGSGKNRRTVTKVRYFNVRGGYDMAFDDLMVEVSPSLTQNQLSKVGAFDTKSAVAYTEEFIAGHASERYDTDVNEAYTTAKQMMSERIRSGILSQYSHDVVDYLNVRTDFRASTFKQILVPLWCSAFKYRQKLYNYFVNGRTGKVGGKAPVAVWKVLLTVIIIIGAAVGIYFGFFR